MVFDDAILPESFLDLIRREHVAVRRRRHGELPPRLRARGVSPSAEYAQAVGSRWQRGPGEGEAAGRAAASAPRSIESDPAAEATVWEPERKALAVYEEALARFQLDGWCIPRCRCRQTTSCSRCSRWSAERWALTAIRDAGIPLVFRLWWSLADSTRAACHSDSSFPLANGKTAICLAGASRTSRRPNVGNRRCLWRSAESLLSVHVAPIAKAHNQYGQYPIFDRIRNAVIALTNAIQFLASQLLASRRTGIFSESVNSFCKLTPELVRQTLEFIRGGRLDLDAIACHAAFDV